MEKGKRSVLGVRLRSLTSSAFSRCLLGKSRTMLSREKNIHASGELGNSSELRTIIKLNHLNIAATKGSRGWSTGLKYRPSKQPIMLQRINDPPSSFIIPTSKAMLGLA